MGRIFQQTALRFAEHPAVINIERARRFTYARMHELTNRLSNALKHRFGLGRGDFYATILDNDNMALFQQAAAVEGSFSFKCSQAAQ